ncbi:hypothetical protein C8J56DRAFT_423317 [Mycena floridula]|nr:hypothetical protein C8J56DRAFT_423317 [Mycena floridula]
MSEYWVSKKKYFCKYCDIFIADDAPSRTQHENGLRHQGNRDRYIRGLYKDGEKKKKDQEEERREMLNIDRAAQLAYAQDVSAGLAKPGAGPVPSSSSASKSRKPPPKPSNPYANYSTAESLGYSDPDAERIAAAEAQRQSQGVAGEWEVVETAVPSGQPSMGDDDVEPGSLKREAETPIEEVHTRDFKLRKKTVGTGLGKIYDPGVITIKPKKEEDPPTESLTASSVILAPVLDGSQSTTSGPKWTKTHWKRPGEQDEVDEAPVEEEGGAKKEEEETAELSNPSDSTHAEALPTSIKAESPPPPPEPSGIKFKKRKAPATTARGKRDV